MTIRTRQEICQEVYQRGGSYRQGLEIWISQFEPGSKRALRFRSFDDILKGRCHDEALERWVNQFGIKNNGLEASGEVLMSYRCNNQADLREAMNDFRRLLM